MSVDVGDDLLGGLDESAGEERPDPVAAPEPESHARLSFTTKKMVLQAILDKAAAVVPSKDSFPVLKNFYVEVTPEKLRVMATDLELSVISETQLVQCTEGGNAVFPAKKMQEILRTADDGEFSVVVEGGTATMSVGRARWTLRLQSGDEYPDLPELASVTIADVDRAKFLGGIKSVQHATPSREARPTLAMINVAPSGKMTACDGVRFQQTTVEGWPETIDGEPFEIQIPVGAVPDLVRLLRATDQPNVGVGSTDNHLIFRVGNDYFVAAKLNTDFPDMEPTLLRPAMENRDDLTCDRQELIDAVARVRVNADPETSAVCLEVSEGKITVLAKDKQGNRASEEIDAGWSMATRRVVVNHQFLSEMLTMADARSLHFLLGDNRVKSKKAFVVLKDDTNGNLGLINQMREDWILD